MQYIWHKGNNIFAGGLFTDATYVLDTSKLPGPEPQARQPADGHALRVGPGRLLGDQGRQRLRHLHGWARRTRPVHLLRRHTRIGNGFAGSPGEVVRLDQNGKTVYEAPATPKPGRARSAATASRSSPCRRAPTRTGSRPARTSTPGDQRLQRAAQHHPQPGGRAVVVPAPADGPHVGHLRPGQAEAEGGLVPADGPRVGKVAHQEEPRAVMETTVTNLPGHKGAFAETMQGGAIYYTPDITAEQPEWRRSSTSRPPTRCRPLQNPYGGGSNGG